MKLAYFIALTFVSFFSIGLNAQENLLDIYNEEVLSFSGGPFIKNGKKVPFKDVRILLQKFPDSKAEYLQSRKYQRITNYFVIPSAILIGLTFTDINQGNSDGALWIGGLVLSVPGSIFIGKSGRHLQNSVWLYNRDVLFSQ